MDLFRAGDQAEHAGADDNPGDEIPEHKARPEALKDRGDNHRGDQKNQRFGQKRGVMHGRRLGLLQIRRRIPDLNRSGAGDKRSYTL